LGCRAAGFALPLRALFAEKRAIRRDQAKNNQKPEQRTARMHVRAL
jgi:hypothetical protein